MSEIHRSRLEERVIAAAEDALAARGAVTPTDVLTRLGWLPKLRLAEWRQGRMDHLERAVSARRDKVATVLEALQRWAERAGLESIEIEHLAAARGRRPLRFTEDGDEVAERAYRTQWLSPDLPPAQRELLTAKRRKPPELVVFMPLKEWTCTGCRRDGDLMVMEARRPLCLTCTDLDHLVFLPAGDAALTRRARKASTLSAVVVRLSRSRQRYERQGLLVEGSALEHAEEQCLADEDLRARHRERARERRAAQDLDLRAKMTEEILRLFPGCPADRASAIAEHTARRGSGRVGRSAAGRALDAEALSLAVAASVRHVDTDYDDLLMSGLPRVQARARVRARVDELLDRWRGR